MNHALESIKDLAQKDGGLLVVNIEDKFMVYQSPNGWYNIIMIDLNDDYRYMSVTNIETFCSTHLWGMEAIRKLSTNSFEITSSGIKNIGQKPDKN